MEKTKNSNIQILEKLALLTEAMQDIFIGKGTVVFELDKPEYDEVIKNFREIDHKHKQFSIEISGTEFHFILTEDE